MDRDFVDDAMIAVAPECGVLLPTPIDTASDVDSGRVCADYLDNERSILSGTGQSGIRELRLRRNFISTA